MEARWEVAKFFTEEELVKFLNKNKLNPDQIRIVYDSDAAVFVCFYFSCCE